MIGQDVVLSPQNFDSLLRVFLQLENTIKTLAARQNTHTNIIKSPTHYTTTQKFGASKIFFLLFSFEINVDFHSARTHYIDQMKHLRCYKTFLFKKNAVLLNFINQRNLKKTLSCTIV